MPRKPGLTREQHFALGLELAKIQDQINSAIETVGTAYLANGPEVKKLERAGKAIELARSMLDDRASSDLPGDPGIRDMYYPDGHGGAGCTRFSS